MKRGITLPEISISLLIITIALIIFFNLANNLIYNLVNAKKMFLLVNANQEAIEMLIAFRNKNLESTSPQDFLKGINRGTYCISFSTSTGSINLNLSSQQYCDFDEYAQGKSGLKILNKIEITRNGDVAYITSTSKTREVILPDHKLNIILTNWHPYSSP